MKKIAILVSQKYAQEPIEDDELLRDALIDEGFKAEIIAWDNESELKNYDVGIVRSCWDYHDRKDEFIFQLEEYAKSMRIFNSVKTIKWNSDKRYLLEFAEKFNVIKSKAAANTEELNSILNSFDEEMLVLKPTVSASGMNTFRVHSKNHAEVLDTAKQIFDLGKSVLVQKYISAIEERGERSIVVINGECTYAFEKMPAKGNFLVHQHWGGSFRSSKVCEEDCSLAKKITQILSEILNEKPLYMRIDLLYENNEPYILELELIEPGLKISQADKSLKAFIKGIKERIC